MKELTEHLQRICSCVSIDLKDKAWASNAKIQDREGWYFIRTTTPLEVLQRQTLWGATYTQKKSGKIVPVKNINIAERALRYRLDLAPYWNVTDVYSGMASKLLSRAREHTFPDPGTGGLALSKYPELAGYEWLFFFVTMDRFRSDFSCADMMLRLGEQVWRTENGWPLLCSA